MRAYVRNRASPASQRSELSGMRLREYDAPSRVAEGVSGVVVFDAHLVDARRRLNHGRRAEREGAMRCSSTHGTPRSALLLHTYMHVPLRD